MAKKKDIKVDASVGENNLHVNKTDEKVEVNIDTKNIDVDYYKDNERKEFNYDGKKLDVNVKQENGKTEVEVVASNGILRSIGNFIAKYFFRKWNKK